MSISRAYVLESRFEFIKLFRMPRFVVPVVLFPLMFYVFFGLLFTQGRAAGFPLSIYLLATYGTFGVVGATLFSFGVTVAGERGQGWLLVKRASPMPPFAYFFAKIATALAFSALIAVLLFCLAIVFGGVHMALTSWLALAAVLVFGALPFCSIGLAIGYLGGSNSAAAIVQLVYLPMSFLSGLWVPIQALPPAIQHMAPYLPAYHLAQLALGTIGAGDGSAAWIHLAVLLVFTCVALAGAAFGFRRDEGKSYG
jgi:ABC-2 type transport system permease protein